MEQKPANTLSNQELHVLSRQSGILVCRYHMKTGVMESLFDSPQERFGVPEIQGNMPQFAAETGIVSKDTQQTYFAFFERIQQGLPTGAMDLELRDASGEYRWHHAEYTLIYEDNNEPAYALVTFFDNTQARERELATQKWQASVSSVAADAALFAEGNLTRNVIQRVDGKLRSIVQGRTISKFEDLLPIAVLGDIDSESLKEYNVFFDRKRLLGLFKEEVYEDHFDYCVKPKAAPLLWLRATVSMVQDPFTQDIMVALSLTHLDAQQRELEQLSHKAFHDALTGLLNRDGIELRTTEAFAHYTPEMSTALFMIDLDNFKQINDRLGHQVGDMVLKQVAGALRMSFHETDIVGRLGGDEFMVLISGRLYPRFLEKKALELLAATRLMYGDEKEIPISISIGIAYGQGRLTFERLYQTADIALYAAKRAGKCCFHLINADTNEAEQCNETASTDQLLSLQALLSTAEQQAAVKTPFEALVENIPGGVVVIELTKIVHITHCNEWQSRFLGYEKQELTQMQAENPFALVPEDDEPFLRETIQKLRNGKDSMSVVYRMRNKSGTLKYIALNASVTERNDDIIILHGIQTDVDELFSMQKTLQKTRRRLEAVFNAIPGGIAVLEIGTNDLMAITHLGKWIYEYTGFLPHELETLRTGSQLCAVWHEDIPIVRKTIQVVRNGKNLVDVQIRLKHKDGGSRMVNIRGAVIERGPEEITLYAIYTPVEAEKKRPSPQRKASPDQTVEGKR